VTVNRNIKAIVESYKRKYLIVTVPDPVDSQFGFAFDYLMDSTQRALEVQGWVLDRAWLPWETDKEKSVQVKRVGKWAELGWAVEDKAAGNQHAEDPGTLLFRRLPPEKKEALQPEKKEPKKGESNCNETKPKADDKELLIVFLVGETPTSGIHKRAFTQALTFIMQDHSSKKEAGPTLVAGPPQLSQDKNAGTVIRVVGPYFTGSQTSMRLAMCDHEHNNLTFNVISGAAMGVDRHLFCSPCGGSKDVRIRFQATVIPVEQVLNATLHYLARREQSKSDEPNFDPKDIALDLAIRRFLAAQAARFAQFFRVFVISRSSASFAELGLIVASSIA